MKKFRSRFEHNVVNGVVNKLPSKTMQEYKNDCDINVIIERQKCGLSIVPGSVGSVAPRMPQFGDFTGIGDFQHYNDVVNDARAKFMALPSSFRQRFGDDPTRFMVFVQDPANREECEKIGLLPKLVKENNVAPAVESTQQEQQKELN